MFNFDEVLVSSVAHLHPVCFVTNGFDDEGTKSYTSSLAFLGCFSITCPKTFFLTILHIDKGLPFEIVDIKVCEKVTSLLCAMIHPSAVPKGEAQHLSPLSPVSAHQYLQDYIQTNF